MIRFWTGYDTEHFYNPSMIYKKMDLEERKKTVHKKLKKKKLKVKNGRVIKTSVETITIVENKMNIVGVGTVKRPKGKKAGESMKTYKRRMELEKSAT